jgi:hypothetical protein
VGFAINKGYSTLQEHGEEIFSTLYELDVSVDYGGF